MQDASPLQPSPSQIEAFVSDLAAVVRKHGLGLDPGAQQLWNTGRDADKDLASDLQHEILVVPSSRDRLVTELRRACLQGETQRLVAIWDVIAELPERSPVYADPHQVPDYGRFYVVRRSTGKLVGSYQLLRLISDEVDVPAGHAYVMNDMTDKRESIPLHTLGFGSNPDGSANPLAAVDPVTFEIDGYQDRPEQILLPMEIPYRPRVSSNF